MSEIVRKKIPPPDIYLIFRHSNNGSDLSSPKFINSPAALALFMSGQFFHILNYFDCIKDEKKPNLLSVKS